MHQSLSAAAEAATESATPMGIAIREAVAAHPSVTEAPASLRQSRRAVVTATAGAMAQASEDASTADAPQIVDEAAMSLSLHPDRTAEVTLATNVKDHHIRAARTLSVLPEATEAGCSTPMALCRLEAAIGRVQRMRADEISFETTHDAAPVLDAIIRAALARHTPVDAMTDGEVVELVEDCFDSIMARRRHAV